MKSPVRLEPGKAQLVALKVAGRYQLATVTPSNGLPDLNPIRQLARQHGITRKAAARLYAEAMAELHASPSEGVCAFTPDGGHFVMDQTGVR